MALTVDLPAGPGQRYPKVSLVGDGGAIVTLPYAPNELEVRNFSPEFVQQKRPGRDPLLQRAGGQLPELQFTATVVRPNRSSIEDVLFALVLLINSGQRVRIGYTLLTSGLWRITSDTITEQDHEAGTNRCVKANVQLTLTRASEAKLQLGPATGGHVTAAAATPAVARGGESGAQLAQRTNAKATTPKPTAKKSKAKAGQLADRNGIRDFRKVKPGSTVRPPNVRPRGRGAGSGMGA